MWNAIVIAEIIFTSTMCAVILALPFITRTKKKPAEKAETE